MKLKIAQSNLPQAYPAFLRSAGYAYLPSRGAGKESFMRPLGNNAYPRFHIYVDDLGREICFNIHLDQKRASYEGVAAHSGEYEGELVEREVARLRALAGGDGSRPLRKLRGL